MPYSVTWSPTARFTYLNILEYLNEEWSLKEAEAFTDRTELVLAGIRQNPFLYKYSKKSDTHQCVLNKQISLFYRVKTQEQLIELLVFWDNRQDPGKLNL